MKSTEIEQIKHHSAVTVLGSVWNTNRETDRSTVCTQWSSWYCLISWSMHEWFGFDVQCCCIDHFLKTSIFSHVWQAAVQILRFLCVEPVVEFDWNLLLSLSSFQLWLFFKQGSSISPSTNKNPNLQTERCHEDVHVLQQHLRIPNSRSRQRERERWEGHLCDSWSMFIQHACQQK